MQTEFEFWKQSLKIWTSFSIPKHDKHIKWEDNDELQ